MTRPQLAPLLSTVVIGLAAAVFRILRPRARVYAKAMVMERLSPTWVNPTKYGPVTFYCPGVWPYSRSDMAKEPETTRWIESFDDNDIFWDVGANVGVYSLLAARKGHLVYAFEPAAGNYFVLSRNVELNDLADRITFLNVALADKSSLGALVMNDTAVGSAQHNFDVADPQIAARAFRQSCIGYSIDDFIQIFNAPVPSHLKIDVDGIEDKIILGARTTLRNPALKSVLLEIRPDERRALIRRELREAGLTQISPREDANTTQNYVFRRVSQMAN